MDILTTLAHLSPTQDFPTHLHPRTGCRRLLPQVSHSHLQPVVRQGEGELQALDSRNLGRVLTRQALRLSRRLISPFLGSLWVPVRGAQCIRHGLLTSVRVGLFGEFVIRVTVGIDRAIQLLKRHERGNELVVGLDEGSEPFFGFDVLNLHIL